MISAPEEENLIVKWLLAESIYYKNKGKPITYSNGFKWATYTRMQKIIFTVLDLFDIPITRSWYKWGGFVHSDELNSALTTLRADYSRNPHKIKALRQNVLRLGIPVEEVQASVGNIVDKVISMPSKEYLPLYYRTETPVEYRDIYISKQEISNFCDDLSFAQNPQNILKRYDEIADYITTFHASSSRLIHDERLTDANFSFTDLLESSLDKLELLNARGERITKTKLTFFVGAKTVFDDYIWNPYACEISQRTVVGLRADDEREKMKHQEEWLIMHSGSNVNALKEQIEDKRLDLSNEDLQNLKHRIFNQEETAKTLSELIGIYSRAKDGE